MPPRSIFWLRQLAALLVFASGLWQIATLWLAELDEAALLTALTGAAYLLIGVGLFGQSRFTLFLAILVPATALWLRGSADGEWSGVDTVHAAVDLLIILLSGHVLWALRHRPSV